MYSWPALKQRLDELWRRDGLRRVHAQELEQALPSGCVIAGKRVDDSDVPSQRALRELE
ncbi:hypothetical protein [Enhygromyxa salina]|uniref:hypothetical protein n=1 Tax=Enhygromyxa salina TaxID=215803 RepID=UPI0015E68914|nr:hypothetical protein [Enhygromyxa salina]